MCKLVGKMQIILKRFTEPFEMCIRDSHLGVKRILVFVREERLVHYRSIVQLIEDGDVYKRQVFKLRDSFYLEELLLVSVEEELSSSGCNSL